MGPLLSLTTALLVTTTPPGACYIPSDQTAGWKRVELPEGTPALVAPVGIEQFRSGERALLQEKDPPHTYYGASKPHAGRMEYNFLIPKGTFRLDVDFLESLDGAKVDVTAYVGARPYPLLSGRRRFGTNLVLDWDVRDVSSVVVSVHHHLREEPVVRHWEVSREVYPSQEETLLASFRAGRSLYYRHPGGRRIELCGNPNQLLLLSRWPEGEPVAVTLTRAGAAAP
ncbi:hypothetical protein [Hyalangium versicolor]|uniref:hypothetical protein n=1 Tax=Hyalangium versicolor TaxID=2861190 RepID=UPI001CCB52F8|nr:hypothetical protein [Hyalangium versicolor]